MYSASIQAFIDDPWRAMNPIAVGRIPTGGGAPEYVVVTREGEPFARIDLYIKGDVRGPFVEVVSWARFVVVGIDSAAHLVDPATREVRTVACDFYFGHIYPLEDRLLIASASELICMDPDGRELWRRGD